MSTTDNSSQMLLIGTTCSDPHCQLVDFLPLKCQHCSLPFCSSHFLPSGHSCTKYDAAKYDRVSPNCPLCNEVVSVRPGENPNTRMEAHIASACSAVHGANAQKKQTGPICAKAKCGKHLVVPIKCETCNQAFCPAHRFPTSHVCSPPANKSASSQPFGKPQDSKNKAASGSKLNSFLRPTNNSRPQTTQTTAAKPTVAQAKPAPSTKTQGASTSSSSSRPNPFSKNDRRAKAELESQRKAMRERQKKGVCYIFILFESSCFLKYLVIIQAFERRRKAHSG